MTPSYGVGDPQYGFEPIEWTWVVERMTEARSYWIVTTRADGCPHVMPVWGVWVKDAFHFVTDTESLKARNILRDPRAAVHLESGDEVVILEGRFNPASVTQEVVQAYERKYEMSLGNVSEGLFRLRPAKALAWTESDFPKTRHPLALRARSLTVYEGLTITDGDRLCDMLRDDDIFRNCDFDGADFVDIEVDSLRIESCTLRRANLTNMICQEMRVSDSNLEEARLEKIEAHEAKITGCSLTSAKLTNAQFNLARLIDCDLSGAELDRANLFGADLTGSRFRGVDLSTAKLDGVKIERADFSMASLRGHSFANQTLTGVNFTESDLDGCDFTGAVFENCKLSGAFVTEYTKLDGADLRGALISGEHIVKASLIGAMMLPSQVSALAFDAYGIIVAEDAEK